MFSTEVAVYNLHGKVEADRNSKVLLDLPVKLDTRILEKGPSCAVYQYSVISMRSKYSYYASK